jgi:hypothetical protein
VLNFHQIAVMPDVIPDRETVFARTSRERVTGARRPTLHRGGNGPEKTHTGFMESQRDFTAGKSRDPPSDFLQASI